jgi:hypothetical protein
MKIIEEAFNESVCEISCDSKWMDSKYEKVKHMSNTGKGKFGENFTTRLLNKIGVIAEVINGGIGDFDIFLKEFDIKMEHKLATEDVSGAFQFNGLDKNKDYDYVFCLGVSPNDLFFDILPKKAMMNLTTNMTKAGGGFKLCLKKTKLYELTEDELISKIEEIIDNAECLG